MVERYSQPGLPSLVVGTPGVDRSAGAAAADIAKVSDQAVAGEQQLANQELKQAGSDFTQSMVASYYANEGRLHQLARQQEIRRQQQALQDELAFDFEKPKIDAQLDQEEGQLRTAMAGGPNDPTAPRGAAQVWDKNTPEFLRNINEQYQDRPGLLKPALAYAANQRIARQGNLSQWEAGMVTANLGLRADTVPAEYAQAVGNNIDYSQPLPQIEAAFQKTTIDTLRPISTLLKQTAANPDVSSRNKVAELQTHMSNLASHGAEQVLQNAISMVPLSQEGLNKLDQIEQKIRNPKGSAFVLSGDAPEKLIGQIGAQRKAVIEGASQQYKTNALTIQAHAESVIAALDEDFNTPSLRQKHLGADPTWQSSNDRSVPTWLAVYPSAGDDR